MLLNAFLLLFKYCWQNHKKIDKITYLEIKIVKINSEECSLFQENCIDINPLGRRKINVNIVAKSLIKHTFGVSSHERIHTGLRSLINMMLCYMSYW